MKMIIQEIRSKEATHLAEPRIARFLFADTRMAWFWLLVRVYVGYQWLTMGLLKLTGHDFTIGASFGQATKNGAWVFSIHDGAAVQSFVMGALPKAAGTYPDVQSWYAAFLQNVVLPHAGVFAYLVTFGEVLVGLALIFGALTGVAAFFGVFMNMSYLLAGSVYINPIIGALAVFLILAWRVAGYYGVDSFLLPRLITLERQAYPPRPPKKTPKMTIATDEAEASGSRF